MYFMGTGYCPIKTEEGKCGAGGECNRDKCWEKIHYGSPPKELSDKIEKWRSVRRGDGKKWGKQK